MLVPGHLHSEFVTVVTPKEGHNFDNPVVPVLENDGRLLQARAQAIFLSSTILLGRRPHIFVCCLAFDFPKIVFGLDPSLYDLLYLVERIQRQLLGRAPKQPLFREEPISYE